MTMMQHGCVWLLCFVAQPHVLGAFAPQLADQCLEEGKALVCVVCVGWGWGYGHRVSSTE